MQRAHVLAGNVIRIKRGKQVDEPAGLVVQDVLAVQQRVEERVLGSLRARELHAHVGVNEIYAPHGRHEQELAGPVRLVGDRVIGSHVRDGAVFVDGHDVLHLERVGRRANELFWQQRLISLVSLVSLVCFLPFGMQQHHVLFRHLGTLGQPDRIVGALQAGQDGFYAGAERVGQLFCSVERGPLPDRVIQHLNLNFVFGLRFGDLGLGKRVRGNHLVIIASIASIASIIAARFLHDAHVHYERK